MFKTTLATIVALNIIASSLFAADAPHVMAKSPVEAGRYLVMVAGSTTATLRGGFLPPARSPNRSGLPVSPSVGMDLGAQVMPAISAARLPNTQPLNGFN